MRLVVQRVSRAAVTVDGRLIAGIGPGLVALVAVAKGDGPADVEYAASKLIGLRVFGDDKGKMNRSVEDVQGALLLVSQFTLMGDVRHGRRPAFDDAAFPADARVWYDHLVTRLRASGLPVATGEFQAHMSLELVNDGPVTLLLDSRRLF